MAGAIELAVLERAEGGPAGGTSGHVQAVPREVLHLDVVEDQVAAGGVEGQPSWAAPASRIAGEPTAWKVTVAEAEVPVIGLMVTDSLKVVEATVNTTLPLTPAPSADTAAAHVV